MLAKNTIRLFLKQVRCIFYSLFALIFIYSANAAPWVYPGGDEGGQRFSPLEQINKTNVNKLEIAWTYRHQEAEADDYRMAMQATPIILPAAAGGHLVTCSPFGRIQALDPATGKLRWSFDSQLDEANTKNIFKCRGVSYWQDPLAAEQSCQHRIYMATIDRRIVAVDAQSGAACANFGDNGQVKLYPNNEKPSRVFSTSPPVIAGDAILVGSQVEDFNAADMPEGSVIALDVRSGKHLWSFNPIPEQAAGNKEWPSEPAKVSGAANVWAPMSVDQKHQIVYVPTSAPSPDYYGVYRPGDNGYANSLVALNARDGKVIWYFQFVHHDLWDYDTPSQPVLTTVHREGKEIPAVIQTTKQGLIFMFNRLTGEPLFEIEERMVAKSTMPGELASKTQPFPKLPAPLVNHELKAEDAFGFTPWDRKACRKNLAALRNEGVFTPFSTEPTLYNPSALGGMNWGGASISEAEQVMIVNLSNTAMFGQLVPIKEADTTGHWDPAYTNAHKMVGTPYGVVMGAVVSPLGIPCSPPPWGKLAAINISSGEILWQQTLGSVHEMGPIPAPFEIELGTPNLGGPLLTGANLVFIGSTMDRRFRAFDALSGEKLWTSTLPVDGSAAPMTYMYKGEQYIVIAAGGQVAFGRPSGDYLVAYKLNKR